MICGTNSGVFPWAASQSQKRPPAAPRDCQTRAPGSGCSDGPRPGRAHALQPWAKRCTSPCPPSSPLLNEVITESTSWGCCKDLTNMCRGFRIVSGTQEADSHRMLSLLIIPPHPHPLLQSPICGDGSRIGPMCVCYLPVDSAWIPGLSTSKPRAPAVSQPL